MTKEEKLANVINTLQNAGFVFNSAFTTDSLATATCGMSKDTGCAYSGALVDHIELATAIGGRLADMMKGTFNEENGNAINKEKVAKIIAVQHLAKVIWFELNDDERQVSRGYLYKFVNLPGTMPCGERSGIIALSHGVKLDFEEWEAVRVLDNSGETKGKDYKNSTLAIIVKQANDMAYLIERERYRLQSKNS